jgi:hypothetical protein
MEEPVTTPPEVGFSRSNPFSSTEIVNAPNWDVKIIETKRGDEAWQAIQSANQYNDSPPEGMEYLLVKLQVISTYTDNEEHSISGSDFKVTGDELIVYPPSYSVNPEPVLDARLYTDGETEGWTSFIVGEGEKNLILIVDELMNFDENRFRFVAIEEDASISVPSELHDIHPTNSGKTRDNPVPFGETAITDDWEITITEVIKGEEALELVKEANQFNDSPEDGMEYILIKVKVRNINSVDKAINIDNFYFNSTGNANVLYELPSVVNPAPELNVSLFPGGEYEGWVTLQAAIGETDLIAVFESLFDFSGDEKRFLSLEP